MKQLNIDETLRLKHYVSKYLHDQGQGTVNDYPPLIRAATCYFNRIMEITGYEDASELREILDPFICNADGSPVSYGYYFDKLRDKGIGIMTDSEIQRNLLEGLRRMK